MRATNYTGKVTWIPKKTASFNGTLTGNVGADRGAVRLYLPGRANQHHPLYGEIGGSLILNGTGGYLRSGIFAARKP